MKKEYNSPSCYVMTLNTEAFICASKGATIDGFSSGDTDYGLFGN